jgi:hypothetical protein
VGGRLDKAVKLKECLLDLDRAEERLVHYTRCYRADVDQLLKNKQSSGKEWYDKVRPASLLR